MTSGSPFPAVRSASVMAKRPKALRHVKPTAKPQLAASNPAALPGLTFKDIYPPEEGESYPYVIHYQSLGGLSPFDVCICFGEKMKDGQEQRQISELSLRFVTHHGLLYLSLSHQASQSYTAQSLRAVPTSPSGRNL